MRHESEVSNQEFQMILGSVIDDIINGPWKYSERRGQCCWHVHTEDISTKYNISIELAKSVVFALAMHCSDFDAPMEFFCLKRVVVWGRDNRNKLEKAKQLLMDAVN